MHSFSCLERVCCSMSSSTCCFLTCIQISQEAGQVVWYSHLFQNFPQFIVIHSTELPQILIDHSSYPLGSFKRAWILIPEIMTQLLSLGISGAGKLFLISLGPPLGPLSSDNEELSAPWSLVVIGITQEWERGCRAQHRVYPKEVTHHLQDSYICSFSIIQWMLAVWSLVLLPLLNPAWTYGHSWFMYCWSLAWRILSITLLMCEMSAIVQ